MERRIALYDNVLKKKGNNSNFENDSYEKQNSLPSRIRIGFGEFF